MSITDLSKRIRSALDTDSPVRPLRETLEYIDAFVRQQQDAPEQNIMDKMRDDMQSMYKELVDHTSPANVETFVSILCAFLPVFRPIYVITHWWDLILRAALRDPRLSTKTMGQVKGLTLYGLILDSPKATEFRKRIIEFYLDAYDENSGADALEYAAMSTQERKVQKFWKDNLGDVLKEFCTKRPDEFLTAINVFFKSPQWRLRLSILFGDIVRSSEFPVKELVMHPLLDSFLLSLVVDGSSTLFNIEMTILAEMLPHFAVHSPDTLRRVLPFCYAILARVVCWKARQMPPLGRDDRQSDTSPFSPDLATDTARTPHLRSDLDWQKLEATFTFISYPPSPLPLFRCLYSLYPCNTLSFLRNPVFYLTHTDLKSPFLENWSEILDEGQIRTRSQALLRQTSLHFSLLMHTAESELAEPERWIKWDVPRVAMMCTMVDVRNAALSLSQMPDEHQTSGIAPFEQGGSTCDEMQSEKPEAKNLRGTDFSVPGRPHVSVQDVLATYHALKSGLEVDIVNPTPTWPHLLFPAIVPSSSAADSMTSSTRSPVTYDGSIPPHVEDMVSRLQRENLLLRNELNYELWLKRENVKRVGQLYQDHILVKGAEVERQGLHNKLREYKGQVQRLQDALSKDQAGATATKSQHTDYTNRLQARLKAEREAKRSWAEEKSELKRAYDDAKAMLDAQSVRLADATTRVFELETQIKEDAPKVQRLRDYENKIGQLTKTQQLWDEDIRRYKKQESYLDNLRSRYRKKLLLIESHEKANQELEETIIALKKHISTLESQTISRRPPESSQGTFKMMEGFRKTIENLTSERAALMNKTKELGDQIEDLQTTVEALRGPVH